jgi:hypothetical protein
MAMFPTLLAASTHPAAAGLPAAVQHRSPKAEERGAGVKAAAPARTVQVAQGDARDAPGADGKIRVLGPIEVDGVAF